MNESGVEPVTSRRAFRPPASAFVEEEGEGDEATAREPAAVPKAPSSSFRRRFRQPTADSKPPSAEEAGPSNPFGRRSSERKLAIPRAVPTPAPAPVPPPKVEKPPPPPPVVIDSASAGSSLVRYTRNIWGNMLDEVSKVLATVQDDLKHLREQVTDSKKKAHPIQEGDVGDDEVDHQIEDALQRAEQRVKEKVSELLDGAQSQPNVLPFAKPSTPYTALLGGSGSTSAGPKRSHRVIHESLLQEQRLLDTLAYLDLNSPRPRSSKTETETAASVQDASDLASGKPQSARSESVDVGSKVESPTAMKSGGGGVKIARIPTSTQGTSGILRKVQLEPIDRMGKISVPVGDKIFRVGSPSPGEQKKIDYRLKNLTNPSTQLAREFSKHVNIEPHSPILPVSGVVEPHIVPGKLHRNASVANHNPALTSLNRCDPYAAEKLLHEQDVTKTGCLSLLERGLVPAAADVTAAILGQRTRADRDFENIKGIPVKNRAAILHPFQDQFMRVDLAEALVGGPTIKLDMGLRNFSTEDGSFRPPRVKGLLLEQSLIDAKQQDEHKVPRPPVSSPVQDEMRSPVGPTDAVEVLRPYSLEGVGSFGLRDGIEAVKVPTAEVRHHDSKGRKRMLSADLKDRDLCIRGGKVMNLAPGYAIFKEKNSTIWGNLKIILSMLEKICKEYSISMAYVSCKLLEKWANSSVGIRPTRDELLDCFINFDEVYEIMSRPGRRYIGERGHVIAATKIQSTWRMFVARRNYMLHLKKKWSVALFSRCYASLLVRRRLRSLIKKRDEKHVYTHLDMLKGIANDWHYIQARPRTIIHLPSLSLPISSRKNMDKVLSYQCEQLYRVLEVNDPNVTIIYVSPIPMTDDTKSELIKSFIKLANPPENFEERLKIITPECCHFFSPDSAVAAMLLASYKAMRRIRNLVYGRTAYIVPGFVNDYELKISSILEIPLLGPSPELAQALWKKTEGRKIMKQAGLCVPPGVEASAGESLYACIMKAIYMHPKVSRWILKIDDHFNGQDVKKLSSLSDYYRKAVESDENNGTVDSMRSPASDQSNGSSVDFADFESWSAAQGKLLAELPRRVTITNSGRFKNFESFAKAFQAHGGVVEASPHASKIKGNPCVHVFVPPGGAARLIGCADQIFVREFEYSGSMFPQTGDCHRKICEEALKLGNFCRESCGFCGDLTVDFVLHEDGTQDEDVHYATGMKGAQTRSASHCNLFYSLLGGSIDFDSGKFVLDESKMPQRVSSTFLSKSKWVDQRKLYERNRIRWSPDDLVRCGFIICGLKHTNFCFQSNHSIMRMLYSSGIKYDELTKMGFLVLPNSAEDAEELTVLCVGKSKQEAFELFCRSIVCLQELISSEKVYGRSNFNDIQLHLEKILGIVEAK